ncbi:MAG: LPS export ABC transporter permease LptG [Pseudomonadota bacterium]
MRLHLYLITSMIKALLPVTLMLLALFSFLALAEELEDVGKGLYSATDALAVVGLTLPNRLLDLLPVMLLLGALIGIGGLAGHSELTAARAIGRSPLQLMRGPILTALAVGVALLLAAQFVVPLAEREAQRLRDKAETEQEVVASEADGAADPVPGEADFWTRSRQQIIRVDGEPDGALLQDVEIYAFEDDSLVSVRQAVSARVIDRAQWELQNVRVLSVAQDAPVADRSLAGEAREVDLPVGGLDTLVAPAASLSLFDLSARIGHARANALDVHGLRVLLWQRLSLPLASLAMMLLALPFVFGNTRVLPIGERVTFGVIAGVAFYLVEQVSVHLAVIYRLHPMVLSLAPELIILSLLGVWLWRMSEG